ncbi:MAG: hypothetical protein SFU53_13240 [Terrimicrobiaceae bacterium]|nr:hypothetical protein [Terrimicrobiaceae bacterium]
MSVEGRPEFFGLATWRIFGLLGLVSIRAVIAAFVIGASALQGQVPDASLELGRPLAPFVVSLKPTVQMSPLPYWMPSPAVVQPMTATVEVPIPGLWQAPAGEFYALTVVFEDAGDGGPAVEWRSATGITSTVSAGLGELGTRLGLNARTVLIPRELTRAGGVLLVSYYGKFSNLVSVSVRPGREDLLAVLGSRTAPAMVDEALRVFERDEVDGSRRTPLSGDVRHGAVVEAELAAGIEELAGELEFVVPLDGQIEATLLRLEALGLDPEARIEARLNGVYVGLLAFPSPRLDDPALVADPLGRFVVAGWRAGSLFVPARFWTPGENSLVLTLRRSEMESGRPVFLKNSHLHVRFGASPATDQAVEPAESEEPDFSLPDPLIPDPNDPPLPEIVTGIR